MAAGETDLLGPENGLDEPQEQGDADHHDDHRQQPARRAGQGDVAEPGGGQGSDREVERVDVGADFRMDVLLDDVDEGRHDEDEDRQVKRADQGVLVAGEERVAPPEIAQDVVGPHQAERTQHPEKSPVLYERGGQEGGDHHDVGQRRDVGEEAQLPGRDPEAAREIGRDDDGDRRLDAPNPGRRLDDRGEQEEQDGEEVEDDQAHAKARRALAAAGIEPGQRGLEPRRRGFRSLGVHGVILEPRRLLCPAREAAFFLPHDGARFRAREGAARLNHHKKFISRITSGSTGDPSIPALGEVPLHLLK